MANETGILKERLSSGGDPNNYLLLAGQAMQQKLKA